MRMRLWNLCLVAAVLAVFFIAVSPADARYGRPARWCGWYMSIEEYGVPIPRLFKASNWRFEGSAARGPCIGCYAVWRNHIGKIVDGPNQRGYWLVNSGNDSNAVRTRYRSLRGVIAFRRPGRHQMAMR